MARTREFNTDKVIDTAINLFWEKGYSGVSTQDLIDKFKISKSSMYGAFGDKMQLFIIALERYRLQVYDEIITRLQNCTSVSKEIKAIFTDVSRRALADKKSRGCFIVNTTIELASHHKQIASLVMKHRKNLEKAFETAIKRGIQNGEFPLHKNAAVLGRIFCNVLSGIQVDAKYLGNQEYFEELINAQMGLLH